MAALLCAMGCAPHAAADVVFLSSGRTLTVRSANVLDGWMRLVLPDGGEITCAPGLVLAVVPDEPPAEAPAMPGAGPVVVEPPATASDEVPFADLVEPLAAAHRVDAGLVRAVIQVESGYRPRARSRRGARGLMQLMPQTSRHYAVTDPYDPRQNLDAGIRHLRRLLDRYDVPVALAAYNAGEGAVARHGGVPPFPETRAYVARILALAGATR
jgi:soluble lytic murein transglycosylase-like protein